MPVVQFHLVDGRHDDEAIATLLKEASIFYVDTLYPDQDPKPIERARAFATFSLPQHWATGGIPVAEGGLDAPYFTCLTLAGRPVEQLQTLLAGITALIERHLSCPAARIRGRAIPVDPDIWSIGGVPASAARQSEVAARKS